jgi:glycosyltransferase involved in cell wall biosynthesis
MNPQYRVSFVMPAFNEEGNITDAIAQACGAGERFCVDHEVIVVDDGSADDTFALASAVTVENPRVRVIRHEENQGYGAALRTGFDACRLDLVFFTDADNQFDLEDLALLLPWSARSDVVAGYRIKRRDPLGRRASAWVWNVLVRLLFYVPVRDVDCAFKLMRRDSLRRVQLSCRGAMVHTELLVKLSRTGCSVVEVGVHHRRRTAGEAGGASPRVVARALFELLRTYRGLRRLDATTPRPGDV